MSKIKTALSPEDKLFKRNKWCYSLPGIGRDMAYVLYNSYLLTFILYTRQLTDKQFSAISIIMIACCIWDGINDPIMGGIIENTRTRFGKFKPWIIIGAATNAVMLAVIFTNRTTGWAFVGLFAVLYLLWDLTFTMNDISYWSMLSSLTSKAHQRDSITSLANLFAGLGNVLANALVPMLTAGKNTIGGNSIKAYAVIAVTISLVFLVGQALVCVTVKEPHVANTPLEERIGIKKLVKVIISNDQLRWVALIMLLVNMGGGVVAALGANYIYLEFGYEGTKVTLFTAFYAGAAGLVYLIYPTLSKKIGRYKIALMSLIFTFAGYIALFLSGTFVEGDIKFWMYCIEGMVVGFGFSLFYMVVSICLMNTIEYNEYKTGSRNEGIIFAVRPFMSKMSSALQKLITMVVYLSIGMLAITNGISHLEREANMGNITEAQKLSGISEILSGADPIMNVVLRCVIVLLPILLISIAYVLTKKKVSIDEAEYERMSAEIEQRKLSAKGADDK